MICLNNTDTLEGGASVDAVVDYTVHGLVGTAFTQIAQGKLSNTDPSVLYTAAAAISIVSVIFVNTHSAAVTVNLYLDPANAGTPRRLIPKALSLGIGYSMHFDGSKITVMDANGNVLSVMSAHKLTHQDGGADEISVQGLSGLLAEDQHVLDSEVQSVIDSFIVDSTDYIKIGNVLVCWGTLDTTVNNNQEFTSVTQTFPVAFKTGTVPSFTATPLGIGDTNHWNVGVGAVLTATQFNIAGRDLVIARTGTFTFKWIAIGVWQ